MKKAFHRIAAVCYFYWAAMGLFLAVFGTDALPPGMARIIGLLAALAWIELAGRAVREARAAARETWKTREGARQ